MFKVISNGKKTVKKDSGMSEYIIICSTKQDLNQARIASQIQSNVFDLCAKPHRCRQEIFTMPTQINTEETERITKRCNCEQQDSERTRKMYYICCMDRFHLGNSLTRTRKLSVSNCALNIIIQIGLHDKLNHDEHLLPPKNCVKQYGEP